MVLGEKFCYVHVPKTGGTSICNALGPLGKLYGPIGNHIVPSVDDARGKIVFTFLREPFALYKSWYAYRKTISGGGWPMDGPLERTTNFEAFVDECSKKHLVTDLYHRCSHVVNTYGNFDRLQKDLNEILVMVDKDPVDLPFMNVASANENWEHLDNIVSEDFKQTTNERESWVYDRWLKTKEGILCLKPQ